MLQRQAQLGRLDLVSYVKTDGMDGLWLPTLYKLRQAAAAAERGDAAALEGFRMAVEVHGGGLQTAPAFVTNMLADIRGVRRPLERAGCKVATASVLREPMPHLLSLFGHFFKQHIPLCQWRPKPPLQTKSLLGIPRESNWDLLATPEGTAMGRAYVRRVLGELDVVGTAERFQETLLAMARLGGIVEPTYLAVNVRGDADADAADGSEGDVADRRRVKLLARALWLQARSVRAVVRGHALFKKDTVECVRHGCLEPLRAAEGHFRPYMCAPSNESVMEEATAAVLAGSEGRRKASVDASALIAEVELALARLERAAAFDTRVYREAGAHLDAVLARLEAESGGEWSVAKELEALEARNAKLAATLEAQNAASLAAKGKLCQNPESHACQGRDPYCTGCVEGPHELARNDACWANHPWKFLPQERHATCTRRWAGGVNLTADILPAAVQDAQGHVAVLPCWNTCWLPAEGGAAESCMGPPCPAERPTVAEWFRSVQADRKKADLESEVRVLAKAETSADQPLFPGSVAATEPPERRAPLKSGKSK